MTSKKTNKQTSPNYRAMSWTPDGSQPLAHICAGHLVPMTQWAGDVFCGVCMRNKARDWEKMAEALYEDFAKMCIEFGIRRSPVLGAYEQSVNERRKEVGDE